MLPEPPPGAAVPCEPRSRAGGPRSPLCRAGIALRAAVAALERTLAPPRCLACGVLLPARADAMCVLCLATLWPVEPPACSRCGLPLEGPEGVCGPCAVVPPPWTRATQAFVYGESIRAAILRAKATGAPLGDGARLVRLALEMGGTPWSVVPELLVPVPQHARRARRRGFNHAALLAGALAGAAPGARVVDALACTRETPPQKGLDRLSRERNLRGVYAVRRPGPIAGRRVLLVDDVVTTGATARACARLLLGAGAAHVDVWAVARVVEHG